MMSMHRMADAQEQIDDTIEILMRIDAQYGTVRFVFNAFINTQQFAGGHDEENIVYTASLRIRSIPSDCIINMRTIIIST